MNGVIPLYPLTNRKLRRGFDKERKKVEHLLVDIECEFEYTIFNAPKSLTYDEIYKYYLDKWHEIIEVLKREYKFAYITIDTWHFVREYRSIV